MSLFLDDNGWLPPAEFPVLHGDVALDIETQDRMFSSHGSGWPFARKLPGEGAGKIIGVSLAWGTENGGIASGYWPVGHKPGGNVDRARLFGWLREQLRRPDLTFTFAHALYDLGWLTVAEGCPVPPAIDDVLLMAPLLDEHRKSYALDAVAKDCGAPRKDETLLRQAAHAFGIDPKKIKSEMWRLPPQYVGPYAQGDAVATLAVRRALLPQIEAQGLGRAYDTERDLLPLLLDMRTRGVRVDIEHVEQMTETFGEREKVAAAEIKRIHGKSLDPWANDAVSAALSARGIHLATTETGKASTNKQTLKGIRDPLLDAIREVRRWNKARTVFLEGYVLGHAVAGRVHANMNQMRIDDDQGRSFGTVTHRFSSSDPNLQNLPSVDNDREVGLAIRGAFLAEEGEQWASVDYGSQEPRLMVHYAAAAGVPGADDMVASYRENPRHDLYQPIADATAKPRKLTKVVFLGLAYGMKDGKLCETMGYPSEEKTFTKRETGEVITYRVAGEEGKLALAEFDRAGGKVVRRLRELVEGAIKSRGYVVSFVDGARFRPSIRGEEIMDLHKTLNKLIQGSAARQTKRAMVELWRAGYGHRVLVPVHDELGLSTDSRATTEAMREIMEHCVELRVPTVLDVAVGPSWGACTEQQPEEDAPDEAAPASDGDVPF